MCSSFHFTFIECYFKQHLFHTCIFYYSIWTFLPTAKHLLDPTSEASESLTKFATISDSKISPEFTVVVGTTKQRWCSSVSFSLNYFTLTLSILPRINVSDASLDCVLIFTNAFIGFTFTQCSFLAVCSTLFQLCTTAMNQLFIFSEFNCSYHAPLRYQLGHYFVSHLWSNIRSN